MGINDLISLSSGFNVATMKKPVSNIINDPKLIIESQKNFDTVELSGKDINTPSYPTYDSRENFIKHANRKSEYAPDKYNKIKNELNKIATGNDEEEGENDDEKETTTEIVRNPDGSVYQVTTITDSEGNVETTTTMLCGAKNCPLGIAGKTFTTTIPSAKVSEEDINLFFG